MKKGISQENNLLEIEVPENASDILLQVIKFLQLFLPVTLAKRLVAVILLAVGMPVRDAVKLTGVCEKSMWTLKKQLREQSVRELMVIKSGSGRKGKTADVEKQILSELESGSYRTRQEIADMIEDKFHIKVSRSCVGRLLKKRHKMVEVRFPPCKGGPRKTEELF